MIKDYLYAIGKYLSPSQREEVLKEIQANLYDYLEENFGDKDRYEDHEVESAILKMGTPKKVAEAYLDRQRALIAPPLLDVYFLLLKIVIPAVSLGLVIANVISVNPEANLGLLVLNIIGQIWSASLSVIGVMTIIFALLYKYLPDKDLEFSEEWTIKDLEKAPEPVERISIGETIFGIAFSVLGLVFFNSDSLIVIGNSIDYIPVVNTAVFNNYLPLINISLVLSILLYIYLLIKRKWHISTRIISMALDVFGVFVFWLIAFNPNFLDFSKIPGISVNDGLKIAEGVQIGMKIGFAAIAILVIVDIAKHLIIMLKKTKDF